MQKRQVALRAIHKVLNTTDGEILMRELREMYDKGTFGKLVPHEMQYCAGQRDVYKYLETLQSGELMNDG